MTIATHGPDKMEVVKSHDLVFLKETENKRPVFAVRNQDGHTASCVCCQKPIPDGVFVGVQYTYDQKKFSALCVECAQNLGIIAGSEETNEMSEPTTPTEAPKRKRGRPPGSTKTKTETKKESDNDMGLNLKGKLGKTAPATTAQAVTTPEEKVTTLIADDGDFGAGLELDEEESSAGLEIDEAPWKEEAPAKVAAPTNGKKADTPIDLRTRIENVDVPKATATGLTKADVQDIVQACLVDTVKAITTTVKEIKTEVNKALSAVQADVREQVKTVMEHVNTVGVSLDALTKKLDAALSDDEEPTATISAPTITVTATNTTSGHEAKKATAAAPKSVASIAPSRQPFADFVATQVGSDGCRLDPLADSLLELGYFKAAPENRDRFLSDLSSLLRARGFKVVDSWVEKA